MSLNADQKSDLLFKKIAAGKATSNITKSYFEELVNGQRQVLAQSIWNQSEDIPNTNPLPSSNSNLATSGVIELHKDFSFTAYPNSTSFYDPTLNLKDIIPYNYGDGSYNYTLKRNDNSIIPIGLNDWYLDPDTGVLTFFNGYPTGVSSSVPPKITCWKYIGTKGFNIGTVDTSDINYDGSTVVNYTPTGGTGLNAQLEGIDNSLQYNVPIIQLYHDITNSSLSSQTVVLSPAGIPNGSLSGSISTGKMVLIKSGSILRYYTITSSSVSYPTTYDVISTNINSGNLKRIHDITVWTTNTVYSPNDIVIDSNYSSGWVFNKLMVCLIEHKSGVLNTDITANKWKTITFNINTDGTFTTTSTSEVPSTSAVKTYIDTVSNGSVKLRGTFDINTSLAEYPKGLASNAVGAIQVGNGSGASNTIKIGDTWRIIGNTGNVGPTPGEVVELNSDWLVAVVDNATNAHLDWNIIQKNTSITTSSNSYLRNTAIKIDAGGAESGKIPQTDYSVLTLQDMMDKILYPFTKPVIELNLNSSNLLGEKGVSYATSLNPLLLDYDIILNDASVNTRNLYYNTNNLISSLSNNSDTYSNITTNINYASTLSIRTFTLKVTFNNFTQLNYDIVFNFESPSYYGVGANGFTESQIKTLTKVVRIKNSYNMNYSPTLNRYYYAYPASWGNLISIKDQNGSELINDFTKTQLTFTLADTITTELMNVYTSNNNTTQVNFNLSFIF